MSAEIDIENDIAAAADIGAPVDVAAQEAPGVVAAARGDDMTGIGLAAFSYVFWGFTPLYWRLLDAVPPFELTTHRVFWCALFAAIVALLRKRQSALGAILKNRKLMAMLALTSVLITCNWTLYIYCVASNQLVEASLGYYITPLISIALGILFFGERMTKLRIGAVALAAFAVGVKAVSLGHAPWISLGLGTSFGLYGYFRKLTPVDSMDGLTVETWILFPFTLGLILWWGWSAVGAFPSADLPRDGLLIFGGPLTAIPLAMFAAGARRIRLSTLGFLQYLTPSITLMLAIFGFGESFTRIDAIAFGLVWIALSIVALEGPLMRLRMRRAPKLG
ncbi:MAG TPA: EamA family transporter RarD [Rhizomicrobium sp.]